jgi:hypothetical protein
MLRRSKNSNGFEMACLKILRRLPLRMDFSDPENGISPAPKRKQSISWKNFIRSHRDVLVGMDFFTTEVLTLKGLTTYYVLFFIHLELAG